MSMEDPGDAGSGFQVLQTIWTTVLTGLGGLLFWNMKQSLGRIDKKVSLADFNEHKKEVARQFEKLDKALERFEETQSDQHHQNSERLDAMRRESSERLDTILLEISKQRDGRRRQ